MTTLNTLTGQRSLTTAEVIEMRNKLLLVFTLAQIIDDNIADIESMIRKQGNYRLDMKQHTKALKKSSRELRNGYYKLLTQEQISAFIDNVDALSQLITKTINTAHHDNSTI